LRLGKVHSQTFSNTPEKDQKNFQDSVKAFLDDCRPAMQTLVSKAGDVPSFMPLWTPDLSMNPPLSDHLSQLNIPQDKHGLPSLLLHGLGEEKWDKLCASHISNIFSDNNDTCVTLFVVAQITNLCI